MESLSSVSPSIVLPPSNHPLRHQRLWRITVISRPRHSRYLPCLSSFFGVPYSPEPSRRRSVEVSCKSSGGAAEEDEKSDDVERALHLDGTIPGTSDEFVKRVSSRAYDMRRHLHQAFDSISYDGPLPHLVT